MSTILNFPDLRTLTRLIAVAGLADRVRLAQGLATALSDPMTGPAERFVAENGIARLAADPCMEVRQALAHALADTPGINPDIALALVNSEDAVALPFLARTPALDRWRMIAILKLGDVARQIVIARRSDLAPEVVRDIVSERAAPVCAALLDNPDVTLGPADFRDLYQRFHDDEPIISRLIARPELPLEIRVLQTRMSVTNISTLVRERGWLGERQAEILFEDCEETGLMGVLREAGASDIEMLVPFMTARGLVTPGFLLRAAVTGHTGFVENVLAHLSDMSPERLTRAIYGRSDGQVKSILRKANIPSACQLLLRGAIEVAGEAKRQNIILSEEGFGLRLVEVIMMRLPVATTAEKLRLLDLVSRVAGSDVREVTARLKAELGRAAAA